MSGADHHLVALGGGYGPINPVLGALIFAAVVVTAIVIVVRRRR